MESRVTSSPRSSRACRCAGLRRFLVATLAALSLAGCSYLGHKPEVELPPFEARTALDGMLAELEPRPYFGELRDFLFDDSVVAFNELFPQGTEVSTVRAFHDNHGGSCRTFDRPQGPAIPLPQPVLQCHYCNFRYDIVYDLGWKIQRTLAIWKSDYRLAPSGTGNDEVQRVEALELTLTAFGSGVTAEGVTEPRSEFCDRFIEIWNRNARPDPRATRRVY
jgi:hypothetical protein